VGAPNLKLAATVADAERVMPSLLNESAVEPANRESVKKSIVNLVAPEGQNPRNDLKRERSCDMLEIKFPQNSKPYKRAVAVIDVQVRGPGTIIVERVRIASEVA